MIHLQAFEISLAERMRFELTMQLPTYYLSRVAPSTTRAPLCVVNEGANIANRFSNPNTGSNQMLISPLNGFSSISTQFSLVLLQAKTNIILVIAASAVMSEPLITPIC